MRRLFREEVLERDNYCCVFCDEKENLDVHHITDRHEMPCDGYAISNGITLCQKHHMMAEQYHVTYIKSCINCRLGHNKSVHDHEFCETCFYVIPPDELYKKIGSSYEKALEDCKKLEKDIGQ